MDTYLQMKMGTKYSRTRTHTHQRRLMHDEYLRFSKRIEDMLWRGNPS